MGRKRGQELLVRGIALCEELVREEPGDRELRVALAKNLDIAVGDLWAYGEYEAGLESYSRAIELWEQLRTEEPNNVEFGHGLGSCYSASDLKRDTGDGDGQAADIRRAVEIFQEILKTAPDDEATLSELATACRRANQLEFLLEGVRIFQQLAAKAGNPNDLGPIDDVLGWSAHPWTNNGLSLAMSNAGGYCTSTSANRGRRSRSSGRVSTWNANVSGSLPRPMLRSFSL